MPFVIGTGEPTTEIVEAGADRGYIDLADLAYPFTGLFVNNGPEQLVRELVLRLRYHVRSDEELAPPEDMDFAGTTSIQRRQDSWLFCSLTGAGFVGNDVPSSGYFNQFTGELRRVHSVSVILVLQQHRTILRLAEDVGQSWADADAKERLVRFRQIADRLHEMTARGMPSQLFVRRNAQRYYVGMQDALDINRIFQQLREAVRDLTEAVRVELAEQLQEQQRRFEHRVSIAAVLFGVPSIVLAFFGLQISGVTYPDALPLLLVLAVLLGSLLTGLAITMGLGRHARRSANAPTDENRRWPLEI